MAMTRSMAAKQNQNASSRKRTKTIDNDGDSGSSSWSYMFQDILFSIILRLGVVDFIAFSGVCKSWRTVALANRNMFMLSRQPMSILVSTQVAKKKDCYLEDSEGRRFKTVLARSSGRTCVGLTCGYLILYGRRNHDFRLVNPITRRELHFPRFPYHVVPDPESLRCVLAFSSKTSSWMFVITTRFSTRVSFSFSSKRAASWTHLSTEFPTCDLHFFQGKIYTLTIGIRLYEVILEPKPVLTLLKMKNSVPCKPVFPEFATLGEKLYVIGHRSKDQFGTVEVDFDQMIWVDPTKTLEEYACFASILKSGFAKLELWTDPRVHYERFGYFDRNENKHIRYTSGMWYCPHKCLDVNMLLE